MFLKFGKHTLLRQRCAQFFFAIPISIKQLLRTSCLTRDASLILFMDRGGGGGSVSISVANGFSIILMRCCYCVLFLKLIFAADVKRITVSTAKSIEGGEEKFVVLQSELADILIFPILARFILRGAFE